MIFNNIYIRSLVLAICYVGALCFAYLSFYSAKPRFQELLLEEKKLNSQKETLDKQLSNLKELANFLKEKAGVLELFSLAFPKDDAGLPELFVEIENLSQLSGVTIEDLQINLSGTPSSLPIGKAEPTKGGEASQGETLSYGSVPLSLTIKGSIPQIEAFLDELYNNLRVLVVKNFSLDRGENNPASNVLTAKVQFDAVYFISQTENTTGAGAPATSPSSE